MSNNKSNNKKVVVKGGKKPTPSKDIVKEQPKVEPKVEGKSDNKETGEKKTTLTKLTQKAGLSFNVNSFRSWLKKYYEQNEMYAPKHKQSQKEGDEKAHKEDVPEDHIPKFKGAHVALAASVEVLCHTILKETISQLNKGNSGLYDVSRPAIKYAVMFNDDLRFLFTRSLQSFKQTMMYETQYCIPRKEMTRYIDTTFGKIINLDPKSYNLLAYLLLSFSMDIASNIFNMMVYANKRTLDFSVIIYALKNLCTGTLEHNIILKIEDAKKLCNEDDDDDETEGEPKEPKQESAKKNKKQVPEKGKEDKKLTPERSRAGSKSKQIEEIEELEMEVEEEGSGDDGDGENDEDEENDDNLEDSEDEREVTEVKSQARNPPKRSSKN